MSADTSRYLDLLERRLALLGSLASALAAARTDVVALDITGLESRIADQEKLCAEIRSLDAHLDRVQQQCATHAVAPAPASDSNSLRCRETLARLAQAQATVKRLNDEHRALLRRSRRTVNALLNSYHSFAMTYANPANPHPSRSAAASARVFSSAEGSF
jgi:uncharacterized coiled-coil protein SlyX